MQHVATSLLRPLFRSGKRPPKPHYLSIVAPVKDEDAYLVEFVAYYLLHGVDHFYLYDNGSNVPVREVLADFADTCTIVDFPGDAMQLRAYEHFCRHYKHQTEWVAVFDVDEFVLPHRHDTFRDFVRSHEWTDGIGINWMLFGDSHHEIRPEAPVVQSYVYRDRRQHDCIKSVLRTDALVRVHHPHFAQLKRWARYVDCKAHPIASAFNPHHTADIIQLNHYFTKSAAEYQAKIRRRQADTGKTRIEQDGAWVLDANRSLNQVMDTALWDRYGERLLASLREDKH